MSCWVCDSEEIALTDVLGMEWCGTCWEEADLRAAEYAAEMDRAWECENE